MFFLFDRLANITVGLQAFLDKVGKNAYDFHVLTFSFADFL